MKTAYAIKKASKYTYHCPYCKRKLFTPVDSDNGRKLGEGRTIEAYCGSSFTHSGAGCYKDLLVTLAGAIVILAERFK